MKAQYTLLVVFIATATLMTGCPLDDAVMDDATVSMPDSRIDASPTDYGVFDPENVWLCKPEDREAECYTGTYMCPEKLPTPGTACTKIYGGCHYCNGYSMVGDSLLATCKEGRWDIFPVMCIVHPSWYADSALPSESSDASMNE